MLVKLFSCSLRVDLPDGTRRVEIAKEQTCRDAQQAELLFEARVAVFDTKKAELVTQKILAQHSTMMKIALRGGQAEVVAMVALKTVSNQLYGWDREPDVRGMELARTGDHSQAKSYYQHHLEGTTPPPASGAVNLALINTSPEELAAMAKTKVNFDDHDDHFDDQSGPSATERNGQGAGFSVVASEEPPAVTHGRQISEKEALKPPPEGQSAKVAPAGHSPVSEKPQQPPDRFEQIAHPAPLAQTPFGQTPQNSFSRPPSWHEHRRANWEKDRYRK